MTAAERKAAERERKRALYLSHRNRQTRSKKMTSFSKGQIIELNGAPATVIEFTKSMVLVEFETMNGTMRKGVSIAALK